MYYTAELNNKNKLNYYKVTSKESKKVSKKQYDIYFKRLFPNKKNNIMEGGMIDLKKYKSQPKISINRFNSFNDKDENNPKQKNYIGGRDDVLYNVYEPRQKFLVVGLEEYKDFEKDKLKEKYKNTNTTIPNHKKVMVGVFPVLSTSVEKLKSWCHQTCKYEVLNDKSELGMYVYDNNYKPNGFIKSKDCINYNSGVYYVKPGSRKGYISLLSEGKNNWIIEDTIFEYPGKMLNKL